jgi:hypothetical protein
MHLRATALSWAMLLSACAAAGGLSDAQRVWCAANPGSVTSAISTLGLESIFTEDWLPGIATEAEVKTYLVLTLADYFAGEPEQPPFEDPQEQAADRSCKAAYEAR